MYSLPQTTSTTCAPSAIISAGKSWVTIAGGEAGCGRRGSRPFGSGFPFPWLRAAAGALASGQPSRCWPTWKHSGHATCEVGGGAGSCAAAAVVSTGPVVVDRTLIVVDLALYRPEPANVLRPLDPFAIPQRAHPKPLVQILNHSASINVDIVQVPKATGFLPTRTTAESPLRLIHLLTIVSDRGHADPA